MPGLAIDGKVAVMVGCFSCCRIGNGLARPYYPRASAAGRQEYLSLCLCFRLQFPLLSLPHRKFVSLPRRVEPTRSFPLQMLAKIYLGEY